MQERKRLIYKITNRANGKVYIGQTIRGLQARFDRHIHEALASPHTLNKFHRAINKYGADSFYIEQIDEAQTQEELNEKEKFWIKEYDSICKGYNTAAGGEGGNTYAGLTACRLKKTKDKIAKSNHGKNNGMSVQLKAYNVNTKEEHHFETLQACLDFFGIQNKAVIMLRVKGRCNTLWRHTWMFAYEGQEYAQFHDYVPSRRHGTKVKLEKNGETITFNSITKAYRYLKIDRKLLVPDAVINGYHVSF